jgi:hypothetical protein
MTQLTSPEAINGRLQKTEFLTHHADLSFFDNLLTRIRSMERPGDNLGPHIPSPHEAGAWRKAYEIYEALTKRANEPPDPHVLARATNYASVEAAWNTFLVQRTMMLEYARRGTLTEDACVYLGLEPGDLGPAVSKDPDAARYGGRPPNWHERAQRIDLALGRWEEMGASEKSTIPQIMAQRQLAKRLAVVEANSVKRNPSNALETANE